MVASCRAGDWHVELPGRACVEMRPGDIFYIAPGHDSWVVGDEPYVSLHFLGANHYADRS